MPPSLVLLALTAILIPAAARAVLGRPRLLVPAFIASAIGVALAQATGDLSRLAIGVVGDAQLGAAVIGALAGTALVALMEPRPRRART